MSGYRLAHERKVADFDEEPPQATMGCFTYRWARRGIFEGNSRFTRLDRGGKPVKVLLVLLVFAVMALPLTSASAKNRSFDECRQLSAERGVKNPRYPRRYLGLEATGAKSKPQGFMAQCMAGKLS